MKQKFFFALACMLAASIFAQSEADFNVTLTADDSGAVITGYTGTVTAVKIPAAIQGMPVLEIGNGAFNWLKFSSVTLPDGLLKIGKKAFSNQSELGAIVIPDSVTEIGDEAFSYCGLTTVTLPKSLAIAGIDVFKACRLLKTATIPEGVKVIGNGMFSCCTALASVVIPNSVSEIGAFAFAARDEWNTHTADMSLTSVTLGTGLGIIGRSAFWGCRKLTSIIIPEGLAKIEDGAFEGCSALASVSLPSTIEEIGDRAFLYCAALAAVTIPDSVSAIFFSSFHGSDAFSGCRKLTLASQAALKKRGYTGSF